MCRSCSGILTVRSAVSWPQEQLWGPADIRHDPVLEPANIEVEDSASENLAKEAALYSSNFWRGRGQLSTGNIATMTRAGVIFRCKKTNYCHWALRRDDEASFKSRPMTTKLIVKQKAMKVLRTSRAPA